MPRPASHRSSATGSAPCECTADCGGACEPAMGDTDWLGQLLDGSMDLEEVNAVSPCQKHPIQCL